MRSCQIWTSKIASARWDQALVNWWVTFSIKGTKRERRAAVRSTLICRCPYRKKDSSNFRFEDAIYCVGDVYVYNLKSFIIHLSIIICINSTSFIIYLSIAGCIIFWHFLLRHFFVQIILFHTVASFCHFFVICFIAVPLVVLCFIDNGASSILCQSATTGKKKEKKYAAVLKRKSKKSVRNI